MNSYFEVGEVVMFWKPGDVNHQKEVTILSELRKINGKDSYTGKTVSVKAHLVQVGKEWEFGPFHNMSDNSNLTPRSLRRRYALQEVVNWADCVWQPKPSANNDSLKPKRQG